MKYLLCIFTGLALLVAIGHITLQVIWKLWRVYEQVDISEAMHRQHL